MKKPGESRLKRICFHWTAGPYTLTAKDFEHYHFTVGAKGEITVGRFKPENNIPPLRNGEYAAHRGGGNSHTIGIAFRGMAGYSSPSKIGKYPLLQTQCEAGWKLAAELCKRYHIQPSEDTIYTHYEFGRQNPQSSSAGKIDITYLPFQPALKADDIGHYIRQKVRWYLNAYLDSGVSTFNRINLS